MIELSVDVDKTALVRFPKELEKHASQAIRKITFKVEGDAKTLVPVDTGFLRNSIASKFPEKLRGRIEVGAEYGAFVEYGTHKMAAQPYLRPAAGRNQAYFQEQMKLATENAMREAGFK